jgi:hypothetical protein
MCRHLDINNLSALLLAADGPLREGDTRDPVTRLTDPSSDTKAVR